MYQYQLTVACSIIKPEKQYMQVKDIIAERELPGKLTDMDPWDDPPTFQYSDDQELSPEVIEEISDIPGLSIKKL